MVLNIQDLTFAYEEKIVLHQIEFSAYPGEVLAVIGPNGSGKSTLIKTIVGINQQKTGKIVLGDQDLLSLARIDMAKLVGYVPQTFRELSSLTVFETVIIGRKPHVGWSLTKKDLDIVDEAMRKLSIMDLAKKRLDNLSGGECQKVFIARAIAQQPKVFLFDEPTSALDIKHQIAVFRLIRDLAHVQGCTVLVVVHDLNFAQYYADKILLMKDGHRIAYGEPDEVLSSQEIFDVYGVEMFKFTKDESSYILPVWEGALV